MNYILNVLYFMSSSYTIKYWNSSLNPFKRIRESTNEMFEALMIRSEDWINLHFNPRVPIKQEFISFFFFHFRSSLKFRMQQNWYELNEKPAVWGVSKLVLVPEDISIIMVKISILKKDSLYEVRFFFHLLDLWMFPC